MIYQRAHNTLHLKDDFVVPVGESFRAFCGDTVTVTSTNARRLGPGVRCTPCMDVLSEMRGAGPQLRVLARGAS